MSKLPEGVARPRDGSGPPPPEEPLQCMLSPVHVSCTEVKSVLRRILSPCPAWPFLSGAWGDVLGFGSVHVK